MIDIFKALNSYNLPSIEYWILIPNKLSSKTKFVPHVLLISRIKSSVHENLLMPKKQLSRSILITVLVAIAQGGLVSRNIASETEIRSSDEVTAVDRQFWSFTKPERPSVPEVKDSSRVRTDIDHFILASLEDADLNFHDDADRWTLIRRVTYNLSGLPPVPEAVEAFVNNEGPHAYEQLIDQLLNSPRYGERWGRHWMDVAGYSESSFFIGDQIRPDFWRYRDYVIKAFNDDKPYDVFVREQLAGDEMFDWRNVKEFSEDQIEKLVATGFLRCTPDATDNQPITQVEKIFAAQQAVLEISMKALMGLTLNCVRCHSHKYDPIPHEDYFQLMGIFQPAFDPEDWYSGIWTRHYPGPLRAIPLVPKSERDAFFKESREWRETIFVYYRQLRYDLPLLWQDRFLQDRKDQIEDSLRDRVLNITTQDLDERGDADEALLTQVFEDLGGSKEMLKEVYPEYLEEEKELRAQIDALIESSEELPPLAWATFDVSTVPSPTPLLLRGNFETPGDPVPPGVLTVLNDPARPFNLEAFAEESPKSTTGRRLAFAKWLTDSNHPLTARVMVNRIWQYHFGEGLVRTPDDFGARGSRPTHPNLLNWLAVEFMESGWSIKHMHRLILRSTVYRQSSRFDITREEADPSNRLLNRFSKRRLEAEAIRDGMLAVSGQLDLEMYGESVPTERLEDGRVIVPSDHPDRGRRSVYLSTQRTGQLGILTIFDAPVMDTNAPKRSTAAISQQALVAMNNPFMHENAEAFRDRIDSESLESFEERLTRIWMLAYSRNPTRDELSSMQGWMQKTLDVENPTIGQQKEAWKTLSHAVLSSNEFLYID